MAILEIDINRGFFQRLTHRTPTAAPRSGSTMGAQQTARRDPWTVGFTVDLDAMVWNHFWGAAVQKFGKPHTRAFAPLTSMEIDSWVWELRGGELSFVRITGRNFYGDPITNPYTVIYGPKGFFAIKPEQSRWGGRSDG